MKLNKTWFEKQSDTQKFEELRAINNSIKQLTGVEIFPKEYRKQLQDKIQFTDNEVSQYEKYMTPEELKIFNSL